MTKTLAAVARFKSAAAVARFWRKNNGKRLSSECGRRQRSSPCLLMWLRAVSLAASSVLIYTTAAIHNPNKPQPANYVSLTLSAYHGCKTEKKMLTAKADISECNSRQYDGGALLLSVVAWLWIYCTVVHTSGEVCREKECLQNNSYPNSSQFNQHKCILNK